MRHFQLSNIEKQGGKPLAYRTGGFPHWLIRRLAIFHNISYQNICCFRINSLSDHWVIVSHGTIEPFTDQALLPK